MKRFFEIWQYSHHFVVVCKDSVAVGHTRRFLRRFIEYTLGKVNGHLVDTPKRTYARANASRNIYRMHINALDDFIQHMSMAYTI
jgi:hypothetical protein